MVISADESLLVFLLQLDRLICVCRRIRSILGGHASKCNVRTYLDCNGEVIVITNDISLYLASDNLLYHFSEV